MTKKRNRFSVALAVLVTLAVIVPASPLRAIPTAREIVERLDANQVQDTSYAVATMTIRDRFGERTSTMESWSRGRDLALIEFTSPAERGQKILRTENEIYLFYPDAAELVRLQGAALRESMMGSDVSYEDMTGGKTLLETYNVEYLGEETIDGHRCYEIGFEARTRNVAYPLQTIWIDTELFVARKSEQFSLNGRLLKTISLTDIQEIDGKYIATRLLISDAMKRNSSTEMVLDNIALNIPIDNSMFSLAELSW